MFSFDLPPSNPTLKDPSSGWWGMATQSSLHHQRKEVNPWLRHLRMFVTPTPAVLLAGSLLFVPSALAQDASEPTTGQHLRLQPTAASPGAQKGKQTSKQEAVQVRHRSYRTPRGSDSRPLRGRLQIVLRTISALKTVIDREMSLPTCSISRLGLVSREEGLEFFLQLRAHIRTGNRSVAVIYCRY
jgi:hypothetical protein